MIDGQDRQTIQHFDSEVLNEKCALPFSTVDLLLPSAATLSKAFHDSCKVSAFEQLVDWMKGKEMYSLTAVDEGEQTMRSGQQSAFVVLHFDDSKACLDRQLRADCIDGGDLVATRIYLTDCGSQPKTVSIRRTVH